MRPIWSFLLQDALLEYDGVPMQQTRRDFVRTLFAATAQVALSGPLLTRGLFAANSQDSETLNFLIVGDWGRKGQKEQSEVATQMGLAAAQIGASFIISVGDNFYDYGVTTVEDPQFKLSYDDVYAAPSLQVPWWVILGNHDYRGNCQAQIDYGKVSRRWNMPARYFGRTEAIPGASMVEMLYIDTCPFVTKYATDERMAAEIKSQDAASQLAWIDERLSKSTAPWKIVIGHHPIYSGGEHGDTPELVERLLPVLRKNKVQAYFNGHDHDLQQLQAGELAMFCSGAGSTVRPTKMIGQSQYAKSQPGFIAVALGKQTMEVRMIDNLGQVLHSASVPRMTA
jgi:tartrate-resistant acid phosphatase type 5